MEPQEREVRNVIIFGKYGQVARSLTKQFSLRKNFNIKSFSSKEVDFNATNDVHKFLESIDAKVDVIINATAYTNVDKAEEEKTQADNINNLSVQTIAKYCAKKDIPLIHYSTDYVFDGEGSEPFLESDTQNLNPKNFYGQSKLNGENSIINSGCKYLIFRTSWVWSNDGKNFVNTIKKLSREKEELQIIDDQIGSPTFANDIALNTIKAIEFINKTNNLFPSGVYHLTNQGYTSWHGFATQIINQLSQNNQNILTKRINKIKTSDYKTVAKRPLNSRLDCTKFQKAFNLEIRDWEKTLKEINNA